MFLKYNDKKYPELQANGFAAQYAFPFATQVCKGNGFDVGCAKAEWSLPGSIPVDKSFDDPYHAMNLPLHSTPERQRLDYIFSSHCLEHIPNYVETLEYWVNSLWCNGILFLYLPHYSQEYWRPWNNKKHVHAFTPEIIRDCLESMGLSTVYVTEGWDLNNSFYAIGQK